MNLQALREPAIQQSSLPTPRGAATRALGLCILLLWLPALPSQLTAGTVSVPITLDYPLLQELMLQRLFRDGDRRAEILHDPSGCNRIFLSHPRLSEHRQRLEIVAKIRASLGTAVMGRCTSLLHWNGEARFLAEPVLAPATQALKFKLVDSSLYDQQGQLISSGRLWDLAKGRFRPLLDQFRVDLAPSVRELSLFLPEVLPQRSARQAQAIVDSLRLTDIQVATSGLDVTVSFQIEPLAQTASPETAFSPAELEQWENRWQMMDAVLTFAVKHYANTTVHQELRETLLEILLDARYRLKEALTISASHSPDPVRHWFISSWQRLSPIIREISLENPQHAPMLWITLVTATDTLQALDKMGPEIGLDISSDGLRRLVRLLDPKPAADPLRYEETLDPELQRLFRMPSVPATVEPAGHRFDFWPIRSAHADTAVDRLNRWAPKNSELKEYLPLVRNLLENTAMTTISKSQRDDRIVNLYRQLVLATAWQESCWRQYVVRQKKLVPLRSNTGDVGLMQMNEKVWRGFYDVQKLRWDIAYNIRAGAEVLLNYLIRYALKSEEHKQRGGLDNLARATYSAYNGGPSQVSRYRNKTASTTHKKIDAAFWAKYGAIKEGSELQVARCLGGEAVAADNTATEKTASLPKAADRPKLSQQTDGAKKPADKNWVLQQNENHFTLQLGAFSTRPAARSFIDQQPLRGPLVDHPVRKDAGVLYAVLYGVYTSRSEADRAKQSLHHLKPWVRQFRELQR